MSQTTGCVLLQSPHPHVHITAPDPLVRQMMIVWTEKNAAQWSAVLETVGKSASNLFYQVKVSHKLQFPEVLQQKIKEGGPWYFR